MPESLKKLRIFAASPSDVVSERAKLETVVESLKPMADYLGLTLEVVDWRAVVPDAGRPQQVIFDQIKPTSWDIFVGILWHRFGTPPGAKDKTGKDYLSGTEEEFKTAYELWKQHGKPRMVLYRCIRALPFDVDPDQLKNVRAFFKLIEDVKGDYPTLYQKFDTSESFEKLVLNNLQKLLIEYGEQSKTPITPEVVQVLAPKIPNNLPRRQAFFGRVKEIDKLMRTIGPEQTWGVVIDGIGGIGKSAIAIESAYLAQDKLMFDAFVFITAKTNTLDPSGIRELNPPAHTLDEFLNETVRVLGQPGIAKLIGDEKRRALIDVLRSMRTLLIYDNLETLSKEEQEGIADFLRELPQGCKAIITSRRRGGEGGVWLRVEKLDWDAARGIIENQMSLDVGLANKLNRFQARWQKLFDETNGSPLALVHTLGLMRVRAALTFDGALEMLRGNRDADLQSFIFQEARKELTDNDKIALGALSFFVPSATFEAWAQVANLSRNALETTVDRLVALSLVDVLTGEERYTLHSLTRAFVRGELLTDKNFTQELGVQFAQYWMAFINLYGGYGGEKYKTFDRVELEWTNIDLAMNILWENAGVDGDTVNNREPIEILFQLALLGLRSFLDFSGRWDEIVILNSRGYEAACILNEWSTAGWLATDIAMVYERRGDENAYAFWNERCISAWEKGGTERDKGLAMKKRAWEAMGLGQLSLAEQYLQDALVILKELGDEVDIAGALSGLGHIALRRNEYDAAEHYYLDALENVKTGVFKDWWLVPFIQNLGELAVEREKWADARLWFDEVVAISKEIGDIEAIAGAQVNLARIHEAEGNLNSALALAQEALKIYQQLKHKDLTEVQAFVKNLKNVNG